MDFFSQSKESLGSEVHYELPSSRQKIGSMPNSYISWMRTTRLGHSTLQSVSLTIAVSVLLRNPSPNLRFIMESVGGSPARAGTPGEIGPPTNRSLRNLRGDKQRESGVPSPERRFCFGAALSTVRGQDSY